VREYRLPREAVPTQWLGEAVIWEALLETDMPTTALMWNMNRGASGARSASC
jgi:hypothetical protein